MLFEISEDSRFLVLLEATELELEQIRITLTKQVHNAKFNPRVKNGYWDGYYCYLYKDRFIPIGLWRELVDMAKKFNYPIYFKNLTDLFDNSINIEDFTQWANDFFEGFMLDGKETKPREYQIETAFRILKFRKCSAELATSAGKTMISFLTIAYMLQKGLAKRILFIVPNVSLVNQAEEDFYVFNNRNQIKLKTEAIYSGQKPKKESNVVIGTYQSLVKKKEEYFEDFDAVIVDEMHKVKAVSIKSILEKCINVEYRYGLTGTFPKPGTLDRLTLMCYTGPLVNEVNAAFLQKKGFVAKCEVKVIQLDYAPDEVKEAFHKLSKNPDPEQRKKVYNLEQNYVIANAARLNMITDIIGKSTKNSLVLFHRIEHGEEIYNTLRKKCPDKLVYYVDGGISDQLREAYKKKMEQNDNVILVASFGTFSTGISIKNIHNIFFTESFKSEIIIRQSIGRGLRLHDKKDKLVIIDFVDDFTWGNWQNKLYKHGKERQAIYEDQSFPYEVKKLRFAA
jgi:superfamily II DNA or RNA helicase